MIYLNFPNLDKDTLYKRVLQTIEDICAEYALDNHFGTLSVANQEVVDFLIEKLEDFNVEFSTFIDNDEIGFCYESYQPIFKKLQEGEHGEMLVILTDNLEYQSDYKQLSFSFHVKPKRVVKRDTKIGSVVRRQTHVQ